MIGARPKLRWLGLILTIYLLGLVSGTVLQKFYPVGNILRDTGLTRADSSAAQQPASNLGVRLDITPTPSDIGIATNQSRTLKILIAGNSIALHPPSPDLGWYGNWGMAATTPQADFSHLLYTRLSNGTKHPIEMRVQSLVDFERDFSQFNVSDLAECRQYQADLIIMRIGDNVPQAPAPAKAFRAYFQNLITFLNPSGDAYVIVTSGWFPNDLVNQSMKDACAATNCAYLDLAKLYDDYSNRASAERPFSNVSVGWHPGDKGMKAIADLIWQDISPWLANQAP